MPTSSTVESFAAGPARIPLPHRPPFVFVQQLLRCEPGQMAECTSRFSADDPILAGHFPGDPVVPGVLLTEALAQTAGIAAASGFPPNAHPLFLLSAIRAMKFFGAVRPEEEILLRAEMLGAMGEHFQFKAQARVAGRLVAEGQLILSRRDGGRLRGPQDSSS